MDRRTLLLGGAALALLRSTARAGEFVRLYNGKDLTGWHVQNGKLDAWKPAGEILSCVDRGGGYLSTDEEYGDYELRLEYRIPPAGNTGVGIRYPRGGHPSTKGMEIQILDDDAPQYRNLQAHQFNAAIYGHVAPKTRAAKPPGEWNRMVIRCEGPRIQVHLNGVLVQDVNMDEHTRPGAKSPPLSQMPRKGLIGLQSHGDPVDFRNIEIRRL